MHEKKPRQIPLRTNDARGKRRDILDGALRVFLRQGFNGAGVSEIAAEAAVSKRTLYQYFRSKEDLFTEIVREVSNRIVAPLALDSVGGQEPRAILRKLAQSTASVTVLGEGPALYRMVSAEARRFPQLGRIFLEQGHESGAARLSSYFAQWHKAGALDIPNPKFAADLFFAMVNGIRVRVLLGTVRAVGESELEEWLDFIVDVFLLGVQRRRRDAVDMDGRTFASAARSRAKRSTWRAGRT